MADFAPPNGTMTVSAGGTSVTIANCDISTLGADMLLYAGSRTIKTGNGYKINTVTPTGTSGGTITTRSPIPSAFTAAEFMVDVDGGATVDSPMGALRGVTRIINLLHTFLGIGTNLDASSKDIEIRRETAGSGTFGRIKATIAGRLWFALEHRTISSVETWLLGAYPDGTSRVDAVTVSGADGTVDYKAGEATVASAATADIGAPKARRIVITGTTAITSFGTVPNVEREVRFAGALTLTHNGTSLVLPGAGNIVTAAGDTARAASDAAGNWRITRYDRASGQPLAATWLPPTDNTVTLGNASFRFAQVRANSFYADPTCYFGMAGSTPAFAFDSDAYMSFDRAGDALSIVIGGGYAAFLTGSALYPGADNARSLGIGAARWSVVYAATSTINTSDERDKEKIKALSKAELAAASDMAREIGSFRYLDAVKAKRSGARRHIGLTVQRAIEIMEGHGLNPFGYAFICHDAWPALPATEGEPEAPAVLDDDGQELVPARLAIAGHPGREAGDRYGFRPDQLALFITRGQEARLAAIEAKLAA